MSKARPETCPVCGILTTVTKGRLAKHVTSRKIGAPFCDSSGKKFSEYQVLEPEPEPRKERSSCPSGKIQFDTEAAADQMATSVTRSNLRKTRPMNRTGVYSYMCKKCGMWHMTSIEPGTYEEQGAAK